MPLTDKPPLEIISTKLLNTVGVQVVKTKEGIKFIYRKEVVTELEQLGFSLKALKVRGGETPLPLLRRHVDEQASQESYWSAMAENARYEYNVAEQDFNFWYDQKFVKAFHDLQNRGIPKPTQREVDARIVSKHTTELKKKKEHLFKLEHRYRMLHNACYISIVTKGKMLQTLRNIIQGNKGLVDTEVVGGDISKLRVGGP